MEFKNILRTHFPVISSTNQWAKDNAENFEGGTLRIITADKQTAGRGRFSRPWISTSGENLCATFAFMAPQNFTNFCNLSQIMAISACEVLDALGFKAELKWPNDIMLQRKKVGGILTEMSTINDKTIIVVGIGLNINMRLEILEKIDQPATSLFVESKKKFSLDLVLNALIKQFIPKINILKNKGFLYFLEIYNHKLIYKYGDAVSIKNGNLLSSGSFAGIDNNGALLLKLKDGKIESYFAGDLS